VLDFGEVKTLSGIAVYNGYTDRDDGTYVLKDGAGNTLGGWSITGTAGGTNDGADSFWLTFNSPVTTNRIVLDTTSADVYTTNSFREIQVFEGGVSTGGVPNAGGLQITDAANITLAAHQTETGSDSSANPEVTGGRGGVLVPYTETGNNSYPVNGRNGTYGIANLDDGDVGRVLPLAIFEKLISLEELSLPVPNLNPVDLAIDEGETITLTSTTTTGWGVFDAQGAVVPFTGNGTSSITFTPLDDGVFTVTQVGADPFPVFVANVAPAITETPDLDLANGGLGIREGQQISATKVANGNYQLKVDDTNVGTFQFSDPASSDQAGARTRITITDPTGREIDLLPTALEFDGAGDSMETGLIIDQSRSPALVFRTPAARSLSLTSFLQVGCTRCASGAGP